MTSYSAAKTELLSDTLELGDSVIGDMKGVGKCFNI
jgi:hypothetical protein